MNPAARVVYVDHDPIVVTHNAALLAMRDEVITIRGDIRDPDGILGNPLVRGCLDFARPVAVLLVAVLHFISEDEDPVKIIRRFRDEMAPGSYLAFTCGTTEGADPDMVAGTVSAYQGSRMPFTLRSRTRIMALFDGFALVPPGLVSLTEWRPEDWTDRTPLNGPTLCGVARLS